jgi:hypothetical protein
MVLNVISISTGHIWISDYLFKLSVNRTVRTGLHLPPGKKESLEYLGPGVSEENCGH